MKRFDDDDSQSLNEQQIPRQEYQNERERERERRLFIYDPTLDESMSELVDEKAIKVLLSSVFILYSDIDQRIDQLTLHWLVS